MGVRFQTSPEVGPPKNKKYPSQIPLKRKMKDDIIIHSVMFLTFMALLAQGHGSKDGDVKKDEHGWGGGYKSHHGYGGYGGHRYGGGYGGHKLHYGGGYGGGYGGYKSGYGGGYGGCGRHKFGGYGGYKTGYGGGYGGYGAYGHGYGGYGGYGYNQGYGYGSPYGGLGGYGGYGALGGYGGYGALGGYGGYGGSHGKHDLEDEEKDQATKNTEGYEVPEFDHSYVDNYIHKVHDYVDAGDHYKTDNLQVKVNWNLQDGRHEYLKSQYGIYPQLHPNM